MNTRKRSLQTVIFSSLFLIGLFGSGFLSATAASDTAADQVGTVTVTGSGSVMAQADTAYLNMNINLLVPGTTAETQKRNAEILGQIKTLLLANGLTEDALKTNYVNIYPDYDNSNVPEGTSLQKPNAFRLDEQLSVELKDLSTIKDMADKLATVENVIVQAPSYVLEDATEYLQKAREKAVANVQARVAALAKLFQFNPGKFMNITENSYGGGYGGAPYGGGSYGNNAQEIPVSLDLIVTYQIQQ